MPIIKQLLKLHIEPFSTDTKSNSDKIPQTQRSNSPPDLGDDHNAQVIGSPHPDPLYNLHLDVPLDLKEDSAAPKQPGVHRGRVYPPGTKSTTSSLPRFLPDGHRRFTPDPRLLPGELSLFKQII